MNDEIMKIRIIDGDYCLIIENENENWIKVLLRFENKYQWETFICDFVNLKDEYWKKEEEIKNKEKQD